MEFIVVPDRVYLYAVTTRKAHQLHEPPVAAFRTWQEAEAFRLYIEEDPERAAPYVESQALFARLKNGR
jgi:hypothetical protein